MLTEQRVLMRLMTCVMLSFSFGFRRVKTHASRQLVIMFGMTNISVEVTAVQTFLYFVWQTWYCYVHSCALTLAITVVLVLGANSGKKGPGPLVTQLTKNAGSLPIPITIVPGELSKERLEAIT